MFGAAQTTSQKLRRVTSPHRGTSCLILYSPPPEALGFAIAPEWEDTVLFHLRLLLRLGTEVAEGLPDALDPLPLDRPDSP